MIKKILIANRGEIALRIIRTYKKMGITTVAIYSTNDKNSLHVHYANESICIGKSNIQNSYLNIKAIITAAYISNSNAIHPGIGFLSENPDFVMIIKTNGFKFIGPSEQYIALIGNKINAKKFIEKMGLTIIPGHSVKNIKEATRKAKLIGYPVILKPEYGGGGIGITICKSEQDLKKIINTQKKYFRNQTLLIEKYLYKAKHIEIQILSDNYGNTINLGERECSIQIYNKKILEETPSPTIKTNQSYKLGLIINKIISHINYSGLGTFEFLYLNKKFYFLEVNTRIQIEHTITEMITNIDLIKQQLLITQGKKNTIKQNNIKFQGHSIECRINYKNNKENKVSNLINQYLPRRNKGIRIETYIYQQYLIILNYDNMISKIITFAETREQCIINIKMVLNKYKIKNQNTIIPLHKNIIKNSNIILGNYNTYWLNKWLKK